MFRFAIVIICFTVTLFSKGQASKESFQVPLIPLPQTVVQQGLLTHFQKIEIDSSFSESYFLGERENVLFLKLLNPVQKKFSQRDKSLSLIVQFVLTKNLYGDAYSIHREGSIIEVMANGYNGMFNAVQTLSQLLEINCSEKGYFLPEVFSIQDAPKFSWRGVHLDVSRHFFPVDFIKTYIDILCRYKINRFHWHLTDDQGWRMEIKKYPLLTTIGSKRSETMVAKHFDPYQGDGIPHGGYYTQEEVRDIIAYAKLRGIEVIPEIEMPGHARAALAAYPEYSCTGLEQAVPTTWGVFEDVFCAKDSTFVFLFDILDEVMNLFPSKVIHIGGDEVPKIRWEQCSKCRTIMQHNQLSDAHQLQSFFISKIDSFVTSKGKKIIGWDEILEGGLAPNAMVMSWRGTQGGIAAANMNHFVVMSPGSHCYFDHYQDTSGIEPLAIGGFTSLEKVYQYQPIPEELTDEKRHFILGAQANLWTEYMPTESQVEYMLLPRLCALSEVLWGTNQDFQGFNERLMLHYPIFEQHQWNYRK